MTKPLKVLHVIDSLAVGGAERLLVNVVNNLSGFEHHIITLSLKTDLDAEIMPGCRITRLNFRSKRDSLKCIRAIRRYIRENKIKLVHSHLVMSNMLTRLAAGRRVKVINSLHTLNGVRYFSSGFSWQRVLEKLTYKKRHLLIAVSEGVLKDYQKFIGIKGEAIVLHNFVEDRFFAAAPNKRVFIDKLRMVAVGNIKPQKNYRFLVDAFCALPENIELDIYGSGAFDEETEAKIREHGLKNLRLKGVSNEIEKILPTYDLYVMSSLNEGHPVALLEAMACGMPALVSDIPVLREALGNKGLFFSLSDTSEFITKVQQIARHEIDLYEYAAHNLEMARFLGRKDVYLEKLSSIYKKFILS
jgi:glycosyltransferase involved in cell wall biosynthesis